ncbi:MAG: hypothetical protein AAF251_17905 [Pseudomonadota bacterium]
MLGIENAKLKLVRWRRRRWLAKALRDPGADIIELVYFARRTGMFGQLSACLQAAEVAERLDKRPVMRLTSDNYRVSDDSPEWFGAFFVNKADADLSAPRARGFMRDGSDLPYHATYTNPAEAQALFDRHYAVRPEFVEEVDTLAAANSVGPRTLAIHYRGTDKYTEAPAQAMRDVLDRIARYIDTLDGVENVFVASDVAPFVEATGQGIAGLPVFSLDDAVRSSTDTPVHTQSFHASNMAMGRDALLNCLMLARCGWMCRTTSLLSAWSAIFNPEIEVAILNEPYAHSVWRPEKILLLSARRI